MTTCPYDSTDIDACPPYANKSDVLTLLNELCDAGVLIYDQISGMEVDVESNTSIKIYPGVARDSTNVLDITNPATITIDPVGITGANGIDTGALAADTWYYVYIISGSSGVAGLMSVSASPTMPGGFTYLRRVGWARTEGTTTLLLSQMRDNIVVYDEDDTTPSILELLTNVNLAGTWANYSAAVAIPPGIRRIWIYTYLNPVGGGVCEVRWRETANGISQGLTLTSADSGQVGQSSHMSVDASQLFDLISSNAGEDEDFTLRVHGYFNHRKLLLT